MYISEYMAYNNRKPLSNRNADRILSELVCILSDAHGIVLHLYLSSVVFIIMGINRY